MLNQLTNLRDEIVSDENNYFDGLIDVHYINPFCLALFTNFFGTTAKVSWDSNFFSPLDLIETYKNLLDECYQLPNAKDYIQSFKKWLISNGCPAEELEGSNND